MALAVPDIPAAVASLRNAYDSRRTRSKQWRLEQLAALKTMVTEGMDELCEGIKKDLHRSKFESFIMELNMITSEISHMQDHLDEMMEPKAVWTDPLNLPGWSRIYNDPYGVVLIMAPWNYPCQLLLLPLAGAIAAGNTVLLRPANYTKHTSCALVNLVTKYLDPQCIQIATGDRHMTAALLKERFDFIFFTGGSFVGKMVAKAAAEHFTPTALELGGKSPAIVDKEADLALSARRIIWGAFANAGQTCIRPDYVLVHEEVAEKLVFELRKCVNTYYGTDPQKSEWFARVINARAHKRLAKHLESDKKYIIEGGEADEKECYISPTLLDFGTDYSAFTQSGSMSEELFGPLLPIFRYSCLQQAIDMVNEGEKPLALYIFSQTRSVYEAVLTNTSSGNAMVNDSMTFMSNHNLPFGGVGVSGNGSYHGHKSYETFSHQKSVMIKTNIADIPFRYPPYNASSQRLLKLLLTPLPMGKIQKVIATLGFAFRVLGIFWLVRYGPEFLAQIRKFLLGIE